MSVGGCIAKQVALSAGLHIATVKAGGWIAGLFTSAEEAAPPPPSVLKPASGVSHNIKHASFWAALAGAVAGAIVAAACVAVAAAVVTVVGVGLMALSAATCGAGALVLVGASSTLGGIAVGIGGCLLGSSLISGATSAVTDGINAIMPANDGPVVLGSFDVLVGGVPAGRAGLDMVGCTKHGVPPLIAAGSETVLINGAPAARVDEKTACGAELKQGVGDVFFGGPSVAVVDVAEHELPWWQRALVVGVTFLIPPTKCMVQGVRQLPRALANKAKSLLSGAKNMIVNGAQKGASLFKNAGTSIKNTATKVIQALKTGSCTSGNKPTGAKNTSSEAGKNAPKSDAKVGEPIDTSTGAVVDELEDLVIGSSFSFALKRSYDSQRAGAGLFGWGWRSSLDECLELSHEGEHVEFHGADGSVVPFDIPWGSDKVFNRKHAHFTLIREPHGLALHDRRDGSTRHFQTRGNRGWLCRIEDGHGNGVSLDYEGSSLIWLRHTDGPELALGYVGDPATQGTITIERVDAGVRNPLARYTIQGRLLVDADILPKERLSYAYDSARRRVLWHDHDEKSWVRYSYDQRGRCVRSRAAEGLYSVDLAYDDAKRSTTVCDSRGQRTTYHFDESGRLLCKIDPLGNATQWTYNRHGEVVAITDPLGHTEHFKRDPGTGLLFEHIDREQQVTQFFYDDELRINAVVDALEQAWKFERGALGEIERVEAPDGSCFVYRHNPRGQLIGIERSDGATRTLEYDEQGRLIAQSDWAGSLHRYEYDARDRVSSVTDPGERREQLFWDPRDLLVGIEHADRSQIVLERDHAGLISGVTDENGHTARREYGAFEMLRAASDAEGRRYELRYDPDHLGLSQLLAPDGRSYSFERDEAGRVVRETDYAGRVTRYGLDAAGNRVERINAAGQVTRYAYNKNGRLLCVEADGETTQFEHDALGRLVRAKNDSSELTWEYDPLGRVLRAVQNQETLEYHYDQAGRCSARELLPGPWQNAPHCTSYAHNENGRLTLLELEGGVLSLERDVRGEATSLRIGQGVSLEQRFSERGLLAEQELVIDQKPAGLQRRYAYDAAGNLIQVDDAQGGSTHYHLDRSDRILAAQQAGHTGEAFAYNANGQLARHRVVTPDQDLDLVFETGPEGLPCRVGDTEYAFDAVGRMIRKTVLARGWRPQTWAFTWDSRDRLLEARTPDGQIWRYAYDPLGRRVLKYSPSTRASVHFLWDGDVLLRELYLEAKGSQAMEQVARVVYWHHEPGSFRPLAREIEGDLHLVVTDAIGTPVGLVGNQGEVLWRGRRSVWGNSSRPTPEGQPCEVPLGFPGQYLDEETGLLYNRFRYYDPHLGSYIGPDPIGLAGGTQPWAYVPNPNGWMDPLGLANSCQHVDLTEHRAEHILNRHSAGSSKPNKTEFPGDWSDSKILHEISDVATDPNAITGVGKWNSPYAISTRGGVEIRVDFYPSNHPRYSGKISTGYPINSTPNPP